ncbi:MAG: peptidylprolyl isomerase [Gammaproteobacteria bacterium]|nr:peptidylprolyl isomerase [Gammaproteobacteria bacterium]
MKIRVSLLVACLGVSFSGIAGAQVSAYGAAARVNGVDVSNSVLEKSFEEYQRENNVNIAAIRYPNRVKEMKREVLEHLIDEELVWQTVQAKDLFASPQEVDQSLEEIRAQFGSEDRFLTRITIDGFTPESYRDYVRRTVSAANYMQKVSAAATVSSEEVHDFYVNNPDKFHIPESVKARHILLKVHPSANEETRNAVRERMQRIVEQLADGANFAALAVKYSEDTSASAGGDLGYFQHGQMVKPFDNAAFALQVGETSGVVETIYGLHIIKLEDRQPSQVVPEEMASEQIYSYLLDVKRRQAIRDEIVALRADAEIEILLPL